ncbi:hypothetical protein [Exiguobacterium artemiae]|uniref:hypothetical protein n=1 Tax=Exiguobacterium artemiae TaxID=340145 RepID=UPI002964851F|nr:hypothetical protein [Exiguobacterium sibiricum]MDW2886669.1 hypothetical protein [Exiguobacterium sibiricum]
MKQEEIEVQRTYEGFTPVNHTPVRNMKDLNAIGMLVYLVSHTKDFKITKSGLYTRFGRCIATKSLKRLENEGFFLSFKLRNGSRVAYRYFASDVPFTEERVLAIAARLIVEEGYLRIDKLPGRFSYLFEDKGQSFSEAAFTAAKERHMQQIEKAKIQKSSSVENEQRTDHSANSAVEKNQHKYTKDLKKTNSKKNKLSKTTTSSSVTKNREAMKQALGDEFGHELVATLEKDLLVDKSVSIKTDKQYNALMRYRLDLAKNAQRNTVSNGGALPKWYENEKTQQRIYEENQKQEGLKAAEGITQADIDAMLQSLGVPVHVGA